MNKGMYHKSYTSFSHDYMFQAIDVNSVLTVIDSEPKKYGWKALLLNF